MSFSIYYMSRLVCNVLGSVYPAYASYKAVLSGKPEQHKQWLMYWIVYTIFTVFEILGDTFVSWFPLYWEAKCALVIWLTLYGGAGYLYNRFVYQWLIQYEGVIDHQIAAIQEAASERGQQVVGQVVDQVRGRGTQLAFAGLQWLSSQQGNAQREISQAASIAAAAAASAPTPSSTSAAAKEGNKNN